MRQGVKKLSVATAASDITGKICRLCLKSTRTEDDSLDSVREIIKVLSGIDLEDIASQEKVCEMCFDELQSAWRLRKRILFTDSLFRMFRTRLSNQSSEQHVRLEFKDQKELYCHVCDGCFEYDDLLEHINKKHIRDHVPDCNFCETLLSSGNEFKSEEEEDVLILPLDDRSEEYDEEDIIEEENVIDQVEMESESEISEISLPLVDRSEEFDEDDIIEEENVIDQVEVESESEMESLIVFHSPKTTRLRRSDRYSCKDCNKSYSTENRLIRHTQNKHIQTYSETIEEDDLNNKSFKYSCKDCESSFDTNDELKSHFHEVHNISEIIESLPITTLNVAAVEHPTLDINQKPYACHVCEKAYGKKEKLVSHLRTVHQILQMRKKHVPPGHVDHEPSVCKVCSKSFAYPTTLRRHMRIAHQDEDTNEIEDESSKFKPQFVCPICSAGFSLMSKFDKHLREHNPLPFLCTICDEAFANRGQRKEHELSCLILSATSSAYYKCIPCDFMDIFGVEQLKSHRSIEHSKPEDERMELMFSCAACEESFDKETELLDHLNTHGDLICNVCERKYPTTAQLKSHYHKCHCAQTSLICPECGQKLSRPDKLMEHMWTHTGFLCNICKITFATRKDAQQHRRQRHPEMIRGKGRGRKS